jgi:peptidoglycan-N-acetylglucosamine deacetylase
MGVVQRLTRIALAATQPRDRWMGRGPRSAQAIALTFDDGPHPELTPKLLDLLAKLEVTATFFVVGQQASQHPGLIRRMVAEGHQVANHTWFHHDPQRLSPLALAAEVKETRALLEDLTGEAITLFRPPKGELTWEKIRTLWTLEQSIALWNIDPKDFAMKCPDDIAAWQAKYRPAPGDIVLFHDNHPWAMTVLPQLVGETRAAGLGLITLAPWIQAARLRRHSSLHNVESAVTA